MFLICMKGHVLKLCQTAVCRMTYAGDVRGEISHSPAQLRAVERGKISRFVRRVRKDGGRQADIAELCGLCLFVGMNAAVDEEGL